MALPKTFDALTEADWRELDYFGWRDPKFPKRGDVLLPRLDGAPVVVVLKQADVAAARARRIDDLRLRAAGFAEMLISGR